MGLAIGDRDAGALVVAKKGVTIFDFLRGIGYTFFVCPRGGIGIHGRLRACVL